MDPLSPDLAGSVLVERLRNIGQRLTLVGNRRMLASGVSYARARILFRLAATGPSRAIDLAQFFQLAPRTITDVIDGLERDGLVARIAATDDRRVKHIGVTDVGRAALARATEVGGAFGNEVAAVLGHKDVETLIALVERLDRHLTGAEYPVRSAGK